jgi:hypothetical protein
MPRGFRAPHTCEWREAVARVQIECEQVQAMTGNRQTMINAAKVLDLLNPRGMWRHLSISTQPMPAVEDDDTADLDPLTGCKPVTPRN